MLRPNKAKKEKERLAYLVALMQRALTKQISQQQYWDEMTQHGYTEQERNAATDRLKELVATQALTPQKVPVREVVTDPIAGPVNTPDWELSHEVHALGHKIAEVSTRFRQQISYIPERSIKSIRVKRLFFEPHFATDLSKIPPLRHNFVGHAGLQATASILIVPGGVEIHDPLTGEAWERPEFKRSMQPLLSEEAKTFPVNGIACTAGLDLDGKPLLKANIVGLLVSGCTGSGKSQFLRGFTSELCLKHKPDQLKVALFDVQGSTFLGFERSVWNFQAPCLNELTYEKSMMALLAEATDREKAFREEGFSSIDQWHAAYEQSRLAKTRNCKKPPCRIAVVVDEFGESVSRLGFKAANQALTVLARAHRKHGFSLVVATQTPDKNDFDPALLRALSDRIIFQAANMSASYVAFGYNEDAAIFLLGKGDGFLKHGNTPIRFQAFSLGEDDGKSQIEKICAWGDHLYGTPDVADPWEAAS